MIFLRQVFLVAIKFQNVLQSRLNTHIVLEITLVKTFHDPLGIGFDLETGGHVFQFHFTNQFGMNEVQYIPYTKSDWLKGNIRLGFNISRVFAIKHKNKSTT